MQPPTPADAPPAPPRPAGLHPLLSGFLFVALWLVVSSVATAVPAGVWVVLHRQELLGAMASADPAAALRALLGRHGDLSMLGAALAAAPTFGVVVLCRRLFDKQPLAGLGLSFDLRRLGWGFAAGAGVVLALFGLLVATGDLRVEGWVRPLPLGRVAGLLGLVFLQSGAEELVCRGYLLRTLMSRYRPATAVALVSVFFGALHLLNPGTSLMSFLQTTLIGVLFSLVCLRTGGLWAAIGLHTAWNFTLGAVASLPVSGMTVSHLLEVAAPGRPWLTGGSYGLEASALTLAVVAAGCLALGVRPWRDRPVAAAQPL